MVLPIQLSVFLKICLKCFDDYLKRYLFSPIDLLSIVYINTQGKELLSITMLARELPCPWSWPWSWWSCSWSWWWSWSCLWLPWSSFEPSVSTALSILVNIQISKINIFLYTELQKTRGTKHIDKMLLEVFQQTKHI